MMGKIGALAAGTLLLAALGSARAQDASAIVQRVDDHYNRLSSLKTDYVEHYTGLGMDRTESGMLLLKKPGRMRWIYSSPAGKLFVLDGKYAWSYSPGDAQVQRVAAKQLDDLRSPLRFLLGHTQLKKELENLAVTPEAGGFRITGVPKGMQGRVKQIVLDVSAEGRISRMSLEEMDGATTEFSFTHMEEGLPLADSEFRYTPPKGVAVVEGLPPV